MLQKQAINLAFQKGVDNSDDEKLVISSRFTRMDNFEWRGKNTIRQRPGFVRSSLTPLGIYDRVVANPRRLSALGEDILIEDTAGLHSLLSTGTTSHPNTGTTGADSKLFERAKLTVTDIVSSQSSQMNCDAAAIGDLECYVWEEYDPGTVALSVYWAVRSKTTGVVILRGGGPGEGFRNPRVLATATQFIVFYVVTATDILTASTITVTAGVPAQAVASAYGQALTNGLFDAWYDAPFNQIGLGFRNATGGISLVVLSTAFGAVLGPTAVAGSGTVISISVNTGEYSSNRYLLAAWSEGGNNAYNASMGLGSGLVSARTAMSPGANTVQVSIVADPADADRALIYSDFNPYTAPEPFASDIHADSIRWDGGPVGSLLTPATLRGLQLAGRPVGYTKDGEHAVCVPAMLTSNLQPTVFLVKATDQGAGFTANQRFDGVLARVQRAFGSGSGITQWATATPFNTGGTGVRLAILTKGAPQFVAGIDASPAHITTLELDFNAPLQTVEAQKSLMMAGGCPQLYDGFQTHEAGFNYFPEGITAAERAAGSMTLLATYGFVFRYEWQDAQGVVHRSAPSVPISLALTGANASATLQFPFLRLSDKIHDFAGAPQPNTVRIVCYRTEGNGTVYYRDIAAAGSDTFTRTDQNVMGVWISDIADSALIANEILDVTGGGLEQEPFPATEVLCLHQRRVFMGCGHFVQYTDEIDEDHLSPATSEVYQLRVPAEAGLVVGLHSMDEKLIIVCENQILFVYGQGPNRLGQQNGYSLPEICSNLVGGKSGCQESLALTPDGLWFMSNNSGLRMLTRGLQIAMMPKGEETNEAFLGAEVDDAIAADFTSCRAHAVAGRTQIRFNINGSANIALVWDYQQKQWSRFSNQNSSGGSCAARGLFWHSDGTNVLSSNPSAGSDDGVTTTQVLESAWMALADRQGFERIYKLMLLGQAMSGCTLALEIAHDYSQTYEAARLFTVTARNPLQIEHPLTQQKCEAMRFRITITPGSESEAIRLTSFAIQVGLKPGLNRLPAAQRF